MYLGYTPPVQNRGPGQCLQCSDSPARLSHRLPTRLSLCISLCETLVPSPPPSGSSGRPGHCQLDAQDLHVPTRRGLQGAVPPTASLGGRFLLPCRSGASSSHAPRAPAHSRLFGSPSPRLCLSPGSGAPSAQQGYFPVRGRHPSFSNGLQAPRAP